MLHFRIVGAALVATALTGLPALGTTAGHRAAAPTSVVRTSVPTTTGTVLHAFVGTPDGSSPSGPLLADHGALYGTTVAGGSIGSNRGACVSDGSDGCGTVFRVIPPGAGKAEWTEAVLHTFSGLDGAAPEAGVIADKDGALYGTTSSGGLFYGTVFKLTRRARGTGPWAETVLHFFTGSDGGFPVAGLTMAKNGVLYGTTSVGGVSNGGTVFKLIPPALGKSAWTEQVVHYFTGYDGDGDGAGPSGGLLADDRGALYGTTDGGGGTGCGGLGCGTVFKLTPPSAGQSTWTESILHSFTGADGSHPTANLIADKNGSLFTTTNTGGSQNNGTVVELTPQPRQTRWTASVLHAFTNPRTDGVDADSGLTPGAGGALYGTTLFGGGKGEGPEFDGTLYELTPTAQSQAAWTERILHAFTGGVGGALPFRSGLTWDDSGALYGTTSEGGHLGGVCGSLGCGIIFRLTR